MKHEQTVHTFKLPNVYEKELMEYVHNHYITKSDFIRNAVIEKLQELRDSERINEVLELNEKLYSFEDAKNALNLEY